MDEQTWLWLLERARTSRENAAKATDPAIAAIHMQLHDSYVRQAAKIAHARPVRTERGD